MRCIYQITVLSLFSIGYFSSATLLEVPQNFATIMGALNASQANDTVLVHSGLYQERLVMPSHDFLLISDFYFNHDSSFINNTTIDASMNAEEDTAAVITFTGGNTRATVLSGFTLRGGHGIINSLRTERSGGGIAIFNSNPTISYNQITDNQSDAWCAISVNAGSPKIAHNKIYNNCGRVGLMILVHNILSHEDAIYEWNDIHGNYNCFEQNHNLTDNGLITTNARAIVRYNNFHDYLGHQILGIEFSTSRGEIYGNIFESISCNTFGIIIVADYLSVSIHDNLFRNCGLVDGACIWLSPLNFGSEFIVTRNWFENISNSGAGPASIWANLSNDYISENVFINCIGGSSGAIQISLNDYHGCQALIENNHFYFNHATAQGNQEGIGSAITAVGPGPLCTIQNNWFEGNEGASVNFLSSDQPFWDARNNFWGNSSGPFNMDSNPNGQGDTLGNNINFTPWLTEPPSLSVDHELPFTVKPDEWQLEGNYPNPFNSITKFKLSSNKPQPFEVSVYNIYGQKVETLWRGMVTKQNATILSWDGRNEQGQTVATGVYFITAIPKLSGSAVPKTIKALFLK